jgi:hypothetical protein
LATHLQHSPPNARYLSPTIQNELIDICGRQLQQVIVSDTCCVQVDPSGVLLGYPNLPSHL